MPTEVPPLRRTAISLSLLFLVDAVAVGQGFFSLLAAVVGLLLLLPAGLWATLRRQGGWARSRLLRAGLYLALGAATIAALRLHGATARANADTVIAACQRYRAAHGRFPERLEDLVPGQLASVPPAKHTWIWGEFSYWSTGTAEAPAHSLVYVAVPPFGRRVYQLELGTWGRLD